MPTVAVGSDQARMEYQLTVAPGYEHVLVAWLDTLTTSTFRGYSMTTRHSSLRKTRSGAILGTCRGWAIHYEPGYGVCAGSTWAGERIYVSFALLENGVMRIYNPGRHEIPQHVLDVARALLLAGESTYLLR